MTDPDASFEEDVMILVGTSYIDHHYGNTLSNY